MRESITEPFAAIGGILFVAARHRRRGAYTYQRLARLSVNTPDQYSISFLKKFYGKIFA
jgi:hypothetical protein